MNANSEDSIKDLPMKVLVDLVCFMDLQSQDKSVHRHNLQAVYLLEAARKCGPSNEIAAAAIEVGSRKCHVLHRLGLRSMITRAAELTGVAGSLAAAASATWGRRILDGTREARTLFRLLW